MLLSAKEQLIALSLKDFSYKELFNYLNYLIKTEMSDISISVNDMLNNLHVLAKRDLISLNSQLTFNALINLMPQIDSLRPMTIMLGETLYPELWLSIPQPPILIFYKGNINLLQAKRVSVIGTRKVTYYGEKATEQIVKLFVNHQIQVVSGLANGVDRIAHETAMNLKTQSTIAIIPTGFDEYYPYNNANLQDEIAYDHLLLSEYPPLARVKKHHFIMRNRLVAGLCNAVIVIEAASKSGSLITANYALQFNRELYVLPGRIFDEQSQGCNELLALGANMIISPQRLVQDILTLNENQSKYPN
ncbi:DNA-processing protein DprA [Fundicoccus culcitae]|uniref:DNA-processing protein DprA n=1 Tax=Fundicoccus culcitae TaxID=2969821 RepID=A0ABY5P7K1_9LACT|nr:DNA-processing protein DprA [Fundicoccus culcitae]UUX34428.1 DNA-processing protein DprA [Fundicoccus culcitae]